VDRIDVCDVGSSGEALGVVIDYKSSARQLDPVLVHHGLELQLLAYLGAIGHFNMAEAGLQLSRILPAGAFYVALKAGAGSANTRDEARAEAGSNRLAAWQHRGRFDGGHLDKFDPDGAGTGQFRYGKTKEGAFTKRGNDALPSGEFRALVSRVEEWLRQHGREIFAGKVQASPFRWQNKTACDFCRYRPVCRFDPWTQPYRTLRPPREPETSESQEPTPQ
jgi:ATP-dependent helicase/nuclease subunit B